MLSNQYCRSATVWSFVLVQKISQCDLELRSLQVGHGEEDPKMSVVQQWMSDAIYLAWYSMDKQEYRDALRREALLKVMADIHDRGSPLERRKREGLQSKKT